MVGDLGGQSQHVVHQNLGSLDSHNMHALPERVGFENWYELAQNTHTELYLQPGRRDQWTCNHWMISSKESSHTTLTQSQPNAHLGKMSSITIFAETFISVQDADMRWHENAQSFNLF